MPGSINRNVIGGSNGLGLYRKATQECGNEKQAQNRYSSHSSSPPSKFKILVELRDRGPAYNSGAGREAELRGILGEVRVNDQSFSVAAVLALRILFGQTLRLRRLM